MILRIRVGYEKKSTTGKFCLPLVYILSKDIINYEIAYLDMKLCTFYDFLLGISLDIIFSTKDFGQNGFTHHRGASLSCGKRCSLICCDALILYPRTWPIVRSVHEYSGTVLLNASRFKHRYVLRNKSDTEYAYRTLYFNIRLTLVLYSSKSCHCPPNGKRSIHAVPRRYFIVVTWGIPDVSH